MDGLTDDEVLERLNRLATKRQNLVGTAAVVRQFVSEAHRQGRAQGQVRIGDAILARSDPSGAMAATYTRYDEAPEARPRGQAADG